LGLFLDFSEEKNEDEDEVDECYVEDDEEMRGRR